MSWIFIIVGALDAGLGLVFWWLFARSVSVLRTWPDPGPWGEEKAQWEKLRGASENLRVARVVCINTGGSFLCTGLVLLLGVPL